VKFGTFFDGKMTKQEVLCLASFQQMGHAVTVFSYHEIDLPRGVARADARAILPERDFFKIETGSHRGSPAPFANLFRYTMIKKTDLVWIDTDVFCLRSDWPERPMLLAWQGPYLVNNAILRLPSNHPMLDEAIEAATRIGRLTIWGYTGPFLLTALVHEHEMGEQVLPTESFYPVHWSQATALITPLPAGREVSWPKSAYCVHLWNERLRTAGYDKSAGPPDGSPLAQLFGRITSE
jgi:hypothetical protein